ncbi:IPT/TIG domain-containing protein [Bacteroidota bacterium]
MRNILLLFLLVLMGNSVVFSQKLNIETKSGTDIYEMMDIDSINVISIDIDNPIIYSLEPNWGKIGDTVSIKGKNFLEKDTISTTYVLFGDKEIETLDWTDTTILIQIPVDAVTGSIKVVVRGKESNEITFRIVEHTEAPEIYYIDPPDAERGDTIKIEGKYFGSSQWQVFLENQEFEDYISWSDTLIVLHVPEWAESGMIYVEREDIRSEGRFFEVIKLPIVKYIFPTSGFIGDTIRIFGENFTDLRIISRVWFNGVEVMDYLSWSDSLIIVIVPNGATTGEVTVRIVDNMCSGGSFQVLERIYITRIRPISGYVGDIIEIRGTNFENERGVNVLRFNGKKAEEYVSWSDKVINVVVPEGSGIVQVQAVVDEIYSNKVNFQILDNTKICGSCVDNDGNSYRTLKIGEQCWMTENLNVGLQLDKTERPENNNTIEKHCYNDSVENCSKWGGLYSLEEALNWDTTKIGAGICPEGWRISNNDDWIVLDNELENRELDLGEALVKGGESGFDGLFAGGMSYKDSSYWDGYDLMNVWSPYIKNYQLFRNVRVIRKYIWGYDYYQSKYRFNRAYSVRCIKAIRPIIDSLYSNPTEYGKELVIFGKLFGDDKSKGSVYIEGVKLTNIISWKDTEIKVKIANEARSGRLYIFVNGQQCINVKYIHIKPKIDVVFPQNSDQGVYKYINIKGRNFGWVMNNTISKVFFNNIEAQDVTDWFDTLITVKIPYGTKTGNIYILRDSIYSNALGFKVNIPCGPCIDADGKSYRTLLVEDQCWMGENLNVGKMLRDTLQQTDNGIIEKYCDDNDAKNCNKYGGKYHWNEMMQYTDDEGTQGICPIGWHIPTDDDWKELERNLGMPESVVNSYEYMSRGGKTVVKKFEIGGYSGMEISLSNFFWTSSKEQNDVIFRGLLESQNGNEIWYSFLRWKNQPTIPKYVRCIKD